MRISSSRLTTSAMVVAAAFAVSACGGSETPAAGNTTMTEMNEADSMGSMNDMSAMEAGAETNMAMDPGTMNDMAPAENGL